MTLDTQTLKFFDIKIGHFPDRSVRWLLQDKENVRGLLEIIARELVVHIDFNQLTQINRSFIPDTLREQEADIVFSVPFKREFGTDEILIYILIEHQSTVDISMGFRVLYYMTQIWDFQRRESGSSNILKNELRFRPILPIVFYTGDSNWKYPLTLEPLMDIPEELSGFIPKFDILFLNVKETDLTELTKSDHPFAWLLTVLQKEQSDKETISRVIIDAISNIINLDKEQGGQLQLAINYFLLLILHRRSADEHEELIKLIDQEVPKLEVKTMAKSMADIIEERGIERGLEQGETQAKQEVVLKLLNIRFENIPDDFSQKVTSIHNITDLDLLIEKAATAETIEEIDLQNNID